MPEKRGLCLFHAEKDEETGLSHGRVDGAFVAAKQGRRCWGQGCSYGVLPCPAEAQSRRISCSSSRPSLRGVASATFHHWGPMQAFLSTDPLVIFVPQCSSPLPPEALRQVVNGAAATGAQRLRTRGLKIQKELSATPDLMGMLTSQFKGLSGPTHWTVRGTEGWKSHFSGDQDRVQVENQSKSSKSSKRSKRSKCQSKGKRQSQRRQDGGLQFLYISWTLRFPKSSSLFVKAM